MPKVEERPLSEASEAKVSLSDTSYYQNRVDELLNQNRNNERELLTLGSTIKNLNNELSAKEKDI
jgi:DNA-binding transcriptional regulator YbjK